MIRILWAVVALIGVAHSAAMGSGENPALNRLRRAGQAWHAGRYQTCADLSRGLEDSDLHNPDTGLYLSAQCLFYAGRLDQACEGFERLRTRFPKSPHVTAATYRLADCQWERNLHEQAVATYASAAGLKTDRQIDGAVGLFRRAIWHLEKADVARGQRLWIALLKNHPDHPLASLAPPGYPEPTIDFENALAISRSLHRARRWDEALAVLDSLPDPQSPGRRTLLAFQNGRILFDMRFHYDQAARLLLAARDHAPTDRQREQAWFWASRALGRANRDADAIASHLAMVARYPQEKRAARALYYAGWLAQNQEDCPNAQRHFERTWNTYPDSRWATQARWFAAWCHIRAGQWKGVLGTLAGQFKHKDWRIGGRARYWSGVAQFMLGDKSRAKTTWRKLIERHPLTWYALLARARLGEAAPKQLKPPEPRSIEPIVEKLHQRVDELAAAGFRSLASRVTQQHEKEFRQSHPGRNGLLALMDLYRRLGDYHRPWVLTEIAARTLVSRLPTAATRAIWNHAYPTCERESLQRHTGDDRLLLLLLQSIMRTESGFDPLAHSIADARGLMQLIPPVAKPAAVRLDLPYSPEALFEPELNIHLAADHIGGLAKQFERQWPLVAASYNSNPKVVSEWIRRHGPSGLDRLVEAIPYAETRKYAKQVTTSLARYLYLEDGQSLALNLEVHPPKNGFRTTDGK